MRVGKTQRGSKFVVAVNLLQFHFSVFYKQPRRWLAHHVISINLLVLNVMAFRESHPEKHRTHDGCNRNRCEALRKEVFSIRITLPLTFGRSALVLPQTMPI